MLSAARFKSCVLFMIAIFYIVFNLFSLVYLEFLGSLGSLFLLKFPPQVVTRAPAEVTSVSEAGNIDRSHLRSGEVLGLAGE